ncbi:SusC/RagA family TonB-linked outer membrane protein [Membranihabitans marinus]|uniref:SusC/RagA family TonB-linked outer membrane protein n=1 Tax=Membranihabitans marinus TaxID=1227546 RepID=UPI001F28E1AE|nr:TonB-dependent receptor [Membranihabitans marinus]
MKEITISVSRKMVDGIYKIISFPPYVIQSIFLFILFFIGSVVAPLQVRALDYRDVEKAQETINGRVVDESDSPLIGVNIQVRGQNMGTTTDIDGRFTLSNVEIGAELVFSYIGYMEMVEVVTAENASQSWEIVLKGDAALLDEIVVVGYGSQKKVNVTGAIVALKSEELQNIPASNLSNTLAGRAPGVQIVGTSGLSGASSNIRIRGSFGEPLYVINGIIKSKDDFDALNANEVESISFLKDAASAAIYGSSAGNGVVLVTTKKGLVQAPVIEYQASYSTGRTTKPIQNFSAVEEILYANNVAVTRGQPEPYGQEILDYFSDKSYSINDLIWQDPSVNKHTLAVSGGSEFANYYLSLGYHDERGSYKNLGFKRYNFRSDVGVNITKELKATLNLSGNQRNYDRWYWPYDGYDDINVSDFYRATFNWTRLYPFYQDEVGNPTNDPNDIPVKPSGGWHPPQLMLNEGGYRNNIQRTIDGILRFDLDLSSLVRGLSTSVQGQYGIYDRNLKSFVIQNRFYIFQPGSTSNPFLPGPVDLTQTGSHNLSSNYDNIREEVQIASNYQYNWFVNYHRKFGANDISLLAVYEQSESEFKLLNGQADQLLSTSIDQIYNASGDTERRWFNGYEDAVARASWIGRASYALMERYYAEFSFRYDGNYKFAEGNQWGFFPSFSAGWRLSEEEFLKGISWLDHLKLRASFGQTGSDSNINAWRWGEVYQKTTGYVFGSSLIDGIQPGALPNPDLTWSTIEMWDLGLEFGFLNNRLTGEFDVWGKTESDILGTRIGSTPTTLGASLPAVNYAERSWKGYELSLSWNSDFGDVSYSVYGNMGYAVDQWDVIDEAPAFTDGTYANNWRSVVGKSSSRIGGYISKGLIRTQAQLDEIPEDFTQFGRKPILGTLLFEDIRGANFSEGPDGKIDGNDWTYLSDNGSPRINFGVGFKWSWKGFSMNVHGQGVSAYDRMITTRNGDGVFQVDRPYFEIWARDYWTPETPNAKYPRVGNTWRQAEYGGEGSTFWLRNGAYFRLKNVDLAYKIPVKLLGDKSIDAIQVYFNSTNLFVISALKEHDPEQFTLDSYPIMKTFTGGLILKF